MANNNIYKFLTITLPSSSTSHLPKTLHFSIWGHTFHILSEFCYRLHTVNSFTLYLINLYLLTSPTLSEITRNYFYNEKLFFYFLTLTMSSSSTNILRLLLPAIIPPFSWNNCVDIVHSVYLSLFFFDEQV